MTDRYSGHRPQDEWHRRILALEDGLLPGRDDSRSRTDDRGRPAGPRGDITSRAMAWVASGLLVGAGGVGLLKAIF
jgi:hypothetical protein